MATLTQGIGTPAPIGGGLPDPPTPELQPDTNIKKLLSAKEFLYPPSPAGGGQGPESVLDPLPIDRGIKADAWDAFHAADTPGDFKRQFDALALPRPAKADLFDLKFKPQTPAIPKGAATGPLGEQPNTLPGSRKDLGNGQYQYSTFTPPPVASPPLPPGLDKNAAPVAASPPVASTTPISAVFGKNAVNTLGKKIMPGALQAEHGLEQIGTPGQRLAGAGNVLGGIHQAFSNWGSLIPKATPEPEPPPPDPNDEESLSRYASWHATNQSKQLVRGAIRELADFASPESVGIMVATGEVGKFVPYAANLPYIRDLAAKLPKVLKALDVVSKAAVPAAIAGRGAYNQYQAGVPKDIEAMGAAAVNALMIGAGTAGAIEAGIKAGKAFPAPENLPFDTTKGLWHALNPGEVGSGFSLPGDSDTGIAYPEDISGYQRPQEPAGPYVSPKEAPIPPEQVGGLPAVDPAVAEATAQALDQRGQRLAAQAWRLQNIKTPTEINTDVGKVYLQPFEPAAKILDANGKPKLARVAYHQILDANGKVIVGGTEQTVRDWLQMHTAGTTGGLLKGEGGSGIFGAEPLSTPVMGTATASAGQAQSEPVPVFGTNLAIRPPFMTAEGQAIYEVVNDETGQVVHRGPAETVKPFIEANTSVPNAKEFSKAVQAHTKAATDAALEYQAQHPGVSHDDALVATAGQVGLKPQEGNFQKPAETPDLPEPAPTPEPIEAEQPQKVAHVGPGTKNPPTAALPTEPESPDTIALQLQQLAAGQRKVVMFPGGVGQPTTYPPGVDIRVTNDGLHTGNTYAYRGDMTDAGAIRHAAANNTLTELLGHSELGMGAPDKTALQGEPIAVAGHAPDGTEAQTTVTDADHLPQTVAATHAVTPEGGTISVGSPVDAMAGRTGVPPAPAPVAAPSGIGTPAPIGGGLQEPAPIQAAQQSGIGVPAPIETGPPVAEPEPQIEATQPKAPHEMLLREFKQHPDAFKVPKGHILAIQPDQFTTEWLDQHKAAALRTLATVVGSPVSGTRKTVIENIIRTWNVRNRLSGQTVDALVELPRKELKELAKQARSWGNGSKRMIATGLLNWANDRRSNSQTKVAEANWLGKIQRAVGSGLEIPPAVRAEAEQRAPWIFENENAHVPEEFVPAPLEPEPEPQVQMEHPLTYFTGSSGPAVESRAHDRGDIGLMLTPLKPDYLSKADKYPYIAIDNGVFSKVTPFNPDKFNKLLDAVAEKPEVARKVQFVVAPDVVGDAAGTLAQFPEWAAQIHERGLPVALAAQNGLEDMMDQIPWNDFETLFMGGSTDWKLGKFDDPAQYMRWIRLLKEAAARGKKLHVGRVNSFDRALLSNYGMGALSVDGTHLAYGPNAGLARVESWLNTINNRGPEHGPHFAPQEPLDEAEGLDDGKPVKFTKHGDAMWVSSNDRFRIFDYSRDGVEEFRLLDNDTDEASHHASFKDAVSAAKASNAPQETNAGTSDVANQLPNELAAPGGASPEPVPGVPKGHGQEPVHNAGQAVGTSHAGEPEPVAGSESQGVRRVESPRAEPSTGVRRVTGSADVALVPEGIADAEALKPRVSSAQIVLTADNQRSLETGKIVKPAKASVFPVKWLNPWALGVHEGQPLESEREAINDRILANPASDPGVSPQTGVFGESFNEVRNRLIAGVQDLQQTMPDTIAALGITSGRALQVIDAWARAGQRPDHLVDTAAMTSDEEFSKPGDLFRLEQNGLKKVDRIKGPGLYFAQHGATEWNNQGEGAAEPSEEAATAAVPQKSWKYEVEVTGEPGRWHTNNVAFPTKEEADQAAQDKFQSWMMATGVRTVESDDEPNYNYVDGRLKAIAAKPAEEPSIPDQFAGAVDLNGKSNEEIDAIADILGIPKSAKKPQTGVVSDGEPAAESKPESAPTNEPTAEHRLEDGSGADAVRGESPEALAGVSPEDVQGTAGGESPVQVGDVSGSADGATDGTVVEGRPGVRQGAGDSVPTVVSPAGRKGPAQPDLQSVPTPDGRSDYRLTPEEAAQIENGGSRTKARNNLEAIRTIKKIQAEGNRPATLEEQAKLAKYVGWGDSELAQGIFQNRREWSGIRQEMEDLLTPEEFEGAKDSTINAHYTRRDVAAAMWDALGHMGFRTGASVIEPGMGIGNFFMMMPEGLQNGTRRTGIEMDPLSGSMARALYPASNIVIKPYQDTNLPDNYFDAAIGNVPFQGGIEIYDPVFKRQPYLSKGLHNYFFAKTMLKLRPGGVMLMITSRGTMDSPAAKSFRQWMSQQGELLGAIRLPRDTFKGNAGTSVTVDVLAIRKRVPGEEPVSTAKWIESTPHDMGNGYSVDLNEYYHAHPDMMMGKMATGSMYRENYPELFGTFSLDNFKELLATLPADVIPSWTEQKVPEGRLVENYPDAEFVKEGGFAFQNGQLVRREGAYMQPVTASALRVERAKELIAIRGAAREVLRTQQMEAPEPVILAARKHLNDVYDKFISTKIGKAKGVDKTFGPINSYSNVLAFADDPDWPLLSALENWDKRTKIATKTDIFKVRTNVKPKPVESAETGAEALAVSLNELGRLDWDRMQALTGRTPEELIKELEGKIFRNPSNKRWETADEYLSGNVRQKLADAQFIAKDHPEYQNNVEALEKVQPPDLKPGEIDAPMGATWIPNRVYEKFVNELLQSEGATVKLVPITGGYAIENPYRFADQGVANTIEHGTAYFSGMDLFTMAMNGQSPVARDPETDFNGNERMVKNPKATIEAVEKQNRIMREFSDWFWKDPDRAVPMAAKYNMERNNLRLREYNGSHLTFPGMNKTWMRNQDLDAHQKNAIWRIIQSGNTLLAHAVGAGKTVEMVAAVMEMKRLGLMRKPMIAVPNHLVGQWRSAFLQAYPAAQILVPTKNSFEKKKRARLMSQIATGNFDAVIVGHKSFELLPVQDETFKNFMDEQIDEVEKALEAVREGKTDKDAFNDPTTKQLVRRKTQLEERLKKRTNRDTKDNTVTFEELGVDGLFVDEAHAYKNLGYLSMMDRIAGLPNTDANRSVDMLLKSQYINALHGNQRGLVFATGTPVSNSLAEIWTMMRYLMPTYLKQEGFDQFDAWAKTFGTKKTDLEVAPEGNRMLSRTRFADFVNAPELMSMFRVVADVRTKEQLNLPTPAILGGGETDVVVPASRGLKNYIGLLGERADAVRGGNVDPEDDNMLKISSDGRKASLDLRLVDPTAKEDKNTKAHAAIKNILDIYKEFDAHKAAQLVFLDLSTPKAQGKKKKVVSAVANTDATPDHPVHPPMTSAVANTGEDEPEPEGFDLYGEKEEETPQDTDTEEEKRERFTVYSQIKKNLIAGGIPANEIEFIHDANTDARKEALFDKVNAGTVRVLLGSTEKMGAGMNVQKRLIALHHLDAPWRPSDWEQRNGRIDRQGNDLWDKHQIPVRIYRYMTEGSFDAFMWQTIVAKARPITRFMNGDPSIRRIEEPATSVLSAEQAMAISSGNPEVREKIILDQEIGKIEIMRGGWMNEQATISQTLATVPGEINASKNLNQALTDDIATRNADESLKVNGKEYKGTDIRKDGAAALVDLLKKIGPIGEIQPITASYRGFDLAATPQTEDVRSFATEDKERLYLQEGPREGPYLYSEVMNQHPKKTGPGFTRATLELRALSKKEAEAVHATVPTSLVSKAGELKWYGQISILTKPNIRILAKSANYPASVNYESPAGTIASADHQVKSLDEDLINSQGRLRRLEKQKVELESKLGQPFRDDEKLIKMQRRQRELAEKLGEDKDDMQAVGAMDSDEDNPLAPLLKDPTSAMLPEWFPSRKVFVTSTATGRKSPERVSVINTYLGVQESKSGRNNVRYNLIHIPTGDSLRSFSLPQDAVAFARQALGARDWNYEKTTDDIRGWVRDYYDDQFQAPTETPKESVARLVIPPEEEGQEQRAGPITRYQPLKRKLPTPEYTKGEKGWLHVEIDGKLYSTGKTYLIEGDLKPAAKSTSSPVPPEQIKKYLAGTGKEKPVTAAAFSTATIDGKDTRVVWFSDGKGMDGRYYDDIQSKYPGATFASDPNQNGRIYVNDKAGRRVGLTVFIERVQPPDSIKNLLLPKEHGGTFPPLRRLPPVSTAGETSIGKPVPGPDLSKHGLQALAKAAKMKSLPLDEDTDGKIASAYSTNPEMVELIYRQLRGGSGYSNKVAALHFAPNDAYVIAHRLLTRFGSNNAVRDMAQRLSATADAGKSTVIVNDHPGFTEERKQAALNEELDHATQAALRGDGSAARDHLADPDLLTKSPLGLRASLHLIDTYGYSPNDGILAAEIGVRLMQSNGYLELGISQPEAKQLAGLYAKLLEKEYGTVRPKEIIRRLGITSTGAEGQAESGRRQEIQQGKESPGRTPAAPGGRPEESRVAKVGFQPQKNNVQQSRPVYQGRIAPPPPAFGTPAPIQ